MKICDHCGIKDDNHHNAVGGVVIAISGYHYNHWNHRDKRSNWSMDLCPRCAGTLKDEIGKVMDRLKAPAHNL